MNDERSAPIESGATHDSHPGRPQAGGGCCGGAPKARTDACCVRDEVAKEEGKPGCGCGAAAACG